MKRLFLAAAATAAVVLGGCATATPYQPLQPGWTASGGFSERQIEPNRWQVSFSGNSLTSRQTVETYLLFRSAELTLALPRFEFELALDLPAKLAALGMVDAFDAGAADLSGIDGERDLVVTAVVQTAEQDTQVDELMKTMTERRIRHVPVVEDGRLVGIISIGDVVKHRIDQLEFERDQLDSYLHQG